MFVPGKPIQPSLMYVYEGKARYLSYSGALSFGSALTLHTNIRLAWRALPRLTHQADLA
jgi:hypothetical protein